MKHTHEQIQITLNNFPANKDLALAKIENLSAAQIAKCLAELQAWRLDHEPPSEFHYSALCGALVEAYKRKAAES